MPSFGGHILARSATLLCVKSELLVDPQAFLDERSGPLFRTVSLVLGASMFGFAIVGALTGLLPRDQIAVFFVAGLVLAASAPLMFVPTVSYLGLAGSVFVVAHGFAWMRWRAGGLGSLELLAWAMLAFALAAACVLRRELRWPVLLGTWAADVAFWVALGEHNFLVLLNMSYILGVFFNVFLLRFVAMAAENEWLASEHRTLLAAVPDILLELDAGCRVSWLNPAGVAFFPASTLGRDAEVLAVDAPSAAALCQAARSVGAAEQARLELWGPRHDGIRRLLAWSLAADSGASVAAATVLATARDVTEVRARQAELESMAAQLAATNQHLEALVVTDGLTQLANYRHLCTRFERELRRFHAQGGAVSFLILDVDHFKHYNDKNGHDAGNDLLKALAGILRGATRETDFCARYGGEEFCVLMPDTPLAGALEVAERLRRSVADHPFAQAAAQPLGRVSVSIGLTELTAADADLTQVVARADRALYRAKTEGRDRIEVGRSDDP